MTPDIHGCTAGTDAVAPSPLSLADFPDTARAEYGRRRLDYRHGIGLRHRRSGKSRCVKTGDF